MAKRPRYWITRLDHKSCAGISVGYGDKGIIFRAFTQRRASWLQGETWPASFLWLTNILTSCTLCPVCPWKPPNPQGDPTQQPHWKLDAPGTFWTKDEMEHLKGKIKYLKEKICCQFHPNIRGTPPTNPIGSWTCRRPGSKISKKPPLRPCCPDERVKKGDRSDRTHLEPGAHLSPY